MNTLIILLVSFISMSSFAESLPNYRLGIRSQVVGTDIDFISKAPLADSQTLTYRPAESNYFGITAGYKWIAGTAYFSVNANEDVEAIEGDSDYSDYGFSLFMKNFGFELNYNTFKGYLIDNSTELSPATLGDETYYKLPSMETKGMGGVFYYMLTSNGFSLPAAFDQTEIQTKSSGAWVATAAFRIQEMSNPGAIIPTEKQSDFGADALINSAKMSNYSVGAGYAYNWIIKRFFISPYIGLGIGSQSTEWSTTTGRTQKKSSGTFNSFTRLSLGWNTPDFFLTLISTFNRYKQSTESLEIENVVWNSTFSLGMRF